jgi:hypothetical protein
METTKKSVNLGGKFKTIRETIIKMNEKDFDTNIKDGVYTIEPHIETVIYSFNNDSMHPMQGEYTLKVDFSNYYLANLLKDRIGYIALYTRTGMQGWQDRVLCKDFSDLREGAVKFNMSLIPGDILEMRIFSPIPLLLDMIKFEMNLIGKYKNKSKHVLMDSDDKPWEYGVDFVVTKIGGLCTTLKDDIWTFRVPTSYMVRIKKVVGIEYKFDPDLFLTQGQKIKIKSDKDFAFIFDAYKRM